MNKDYEINNELLEKAMRSPIYDKVLKADNSYSGTSALRSGLEIAEIEVIRMDHLIRSKE